MHVYLYQLPDCPHCQALDESCRAVEQDWDGEPLTIERRNVRDNEGWRTFYGDRVPLLVDGGRVLVEGAADADAVRRALLEYESERDAAMLGED